jgi:biotin carboxylase
VVSLKKILFLGGSAQQVPAIKYAKLKSYYTILCDYLPDNPGQKYVDEYHCISTTDLEAILHLAENSNIDGIVAYASDPAALTAAYVGNKLSLPSNPFDAVSILTKKNLFRKFLKDNGFNCPKASSFTNIEDAREALKYFNLPVMLKPVDSSGSKGVSRIDKKEELDEAFTLALANSRERDIIIEEFIEMEHSHMIGGDGFVINGVLDFCVFLNCHRDIKVNPYVPVGKSFPLFLEQDKIDKAHKEIQRLIGILNIKSGALNIEMMFDKSGNLYIIEVGPRNGGNMIPDLLHMITGVDLVAATVDSALGNYDINVNYNSKEVFYATYILHSSKKGILKDILFKHEIKTNIIKKIIYKEIGSEVDTFDGANKAIGIVFLKFGNLSELQEKMEKIDELVEIKVG